MSDLVPDGWSKSMLGECIGVQGGNAFKSETFTDSGIPVIRISNIKKDGSVNLNSAIYTNGDESLTRFKVENGDILIAMSGATTGKVGRYRSNRYAYLNQRVGRFFVKNNSKTTLDFIHQITSEDDFVNSILIDAVGGAQPNISNQQIESIVVSLPPLPEQQKIAAILSSVDDVIEKTQAQINKLKDLKTGMMQELLSPREGQAANINNPQGESKNGLHHTEFKDTPLGRIPAGWEVKSFSDIFELKNGVNKGKESFGNGVPIISYRNVYDRDGITDEKITGLVEMNESELSRFHSQYGDIFITRTSETPDEIGYANVYLGCRSDVVFSGFVIRARQITKVINPIYSLYAFQTHSIREQMIHNSKFTTRAGISGESLSRLKIAVPPIEEQTKIAEALTSITNRIDSLELKNKSTKSIKKALMQDLLTGKVRVKVD